MDERESVFGINKTKKLKIVFPLLGFCSFNSENNDAFMIFEHTHTHIDTNKTTDTIACMDPDESAWIQADEVFGECRSTSNDLPFIKRTWSMPNIFLWPPTKAFTSATVLHLVQKQYLCKPLKHFKHSILHILLIQLSGGTSKDTSDKAGL